MARATQIRTAPSRPRFGRSHTTGTSHMAYQGYSKGEIIRAISVAHPMAATTSGGLIRDGSPAGWRTRAPSVTTNTRGNTPRTITDTMSPARSPPRKLAAPRRITRTNLDGASHPWRVVSSRVPSVGSLVCSNGTMNGRATATPTPAWAANARSRWPFGLRNTAARTAIASGTPPETFTSVPRTMTAVAHSSRPDRIRTTPAARATPTRASLCPPATPWNTITGFHPTRRAAKAARSGRTRRAAAAAKAMVPRLAMAARVLNAITRSGGESTNAVIPAETATNAGPYTEGESIQSTDTSGYTGSSMKEAGMST